MAAARGTPGQTAALESRAEDFGSADTVRMIDILQYQVQRSKVEASGFVGFKDFGFRVPASIEVAVKGL